MNKDKRILTFALVLSIYFLGLSMWQDRKGPPPAPTVDTEVAEAPDVAAEAPKVGFVDGVEDVFAREAPPEAAPAVIGLNPAKVEPVEPAELVLGASADGRAPGGYHLRAQLDQQGAGISAVWANGYEAEWEGRKKVSKPLALVTRDPKAADPSSPIGPPSLLLNLVPPDDLEPEAGDNFQTKLEKEADRSRYNLSDIAWTVVRDAAGKVVHEAEPVAKGGPKGQAIRFRTVGGPGVAVTKTFRLFPGSDSLELVIELASPDAPRKVAYNLTGFHGIPIEGEWYTSTFRDVFIGQRKDAGGIGLTSLDAKEISNKGEANDRLTERPLAFAGVEDQYFATFLQPEAEDRVAATVPALVLPNAKEPQKADVSVTITSKPASVAPGHADTQTFRLFAGPKTVAALKPFDAEELAAYRKGWGMMGIGNLATMLARFGISPLLDRIYQLTAQVSGGRGSYGIAIILLTVCVRLGLFPLGRKTAMNAKKMQALQPQIQELKEKYKGENEKIFKEQQALFRRNKVSMFGGCLTAVIQLPIFMGLWQALNNSVALRHAPFLWIQNLAAPDMLFQFPVKLPLIGDYLGDYFNILPFVVVALMLVQNKLFMPPATTPEAEMQQKMMKYMMIFMAFMFYKVPSGLGIYFITSSLWSIGERLLLPKVIHAPAIAPEGTTGGGGPTTGGGGGGGGGGGKGPSGGGSGNGEGGGWLSRKLESLMDEAARERTIRNNGNGASSDRRDGNRPGSDRGGKGPDRPRSKPGRRR